MIERVKYLCYEGLCRLLGRGTMAKYSQRKRTRALKRLIKGDIALFAEKSLKYNATINPDDDSIKSQCLLRITNHSIEKGLSMRNTRQGFGIGAITRLLDMLTRYIETFGTAEREQLLYPLQTISNYIDYTHANADVDISEIERRFNLLKAEIDPDGTLEQRQSTLWVSAEELKQQAQGDFRSLLMSRHSIRYFTDQLPPKSLLDEALRLAALSPSACNRQGWRTFIYQGDDCHRLLKFQSYCKGFYDDIHCAILVGADMRMFTDHEIFMPYIDGALYAMNLLNALHYVGLGGIPLCCTFHSGKMMQLREFKIPDTIVPVVIIGCGVLEDRFEVARSLRYSPEMTNTYITLD